MGGSVGQWVGSGQMTKNLINLDLIEMIQFYLICRDTLTHVWVVGWVSGSIGHFLDILLKPPQPLMGLFFPVTSGMSLSFESWWPIQVCD